MGLVITKTHRCIRFHKSRWNEPYIAFLAMRRREAKAAKNEALATQKKLMGNSLGGKYMENPRGRKDVRIVKDEASFLRAVAEPTYVHTTMLAVTEETGSFGQDCECWAEHA